jgi:membrane associated rhomboid family serine protease
MATCYRHPSRETGVACSSCGRPICTDCMTPTPVGMRCPECARQRTKVRTLRSTVRQPYVTYTLIAANVIVFLTEQGQFTLSGSGTHGTVVNEGVIARTLVEQTPEGLIVRMPIAHEHQYWRLITNGFLHESIAHLGFNMLLLYFLGRILEPAIGSLRFAVIYFTALLCGSFGVLVATAGPSLGASGAIFGLMGAAVVELRARGISVMQSGIGGLIILNLVLTFSVAGISIGAHIAGLIGGTLAAFALRSADDRHMPALGFAGCGLLCVLAVAGSIAAAGSTSSGIV